MAKLQVGVNDLATVNPELAKQWHPTKNQGLTNKFGHDVSTPDKVTANSSQKVWWQLPYDVPNDYPVEHLRGKHFDFEWEATVSNRKNGRGCPYLSHNPSVFKGFNDLASTYPEIAAQWHPTKNSATTPYDITMGSVQKFWWWLPYDTPNDYPIEHLRGKHFDFVWEESVVNRINGYNCPYLNGKAVWKGFNDLLTVNPKLASEWHPTKNVGLKDGHGKDISTPDKVTNFSGQKVWWLLPYDVPMDYPIEHLRGQHFDFEWEAIISNRAKGIGCPFLSNGAVWKGFNDLATVNAELAVQWHPTKNGDLKPTDVTVGSERKIWWVVPHKDGDPREYSIYEREARIVDMKNIKKRKFKNLSNFRKKDKCIDNLAITHPELAAQWHPTKNGDLTPEMVTKGMQDKVWWQMPYDVPEDYPIEHLRGKHFDFEWEASIDNRTKGRGCPFLSGQAVWKGFNDLATTHPNLAKEWHPIKNGNLTAEMVSKGYDKKVWWYLPYDVPMDYPVEHLRGKHFDFEWETQVCHRVKGKACPYIAGQAVWKGFNDLATTNPELAAQWHPTKNKGLKDKNNRDISTPDNVTEHSGMKVWWSLSYDDSKTQNVCQFEWQATIASRASGVGCPFIISSKGEESVRKILKLKNIIFEEQYKIKDRFYKAQSHPLKDDFAVFDKNGNVVGTIEFHGIQHYEPVDFAGKGKEWAKEEFKKNQLRDKIKSNYLKEHNIKQLVIPYTEFENVEPIVKNFIDELSNDYDL